MDFIQEIYKLDGSYDDLEDVESSPIHRDLTYRMKKTLYAGDKTETDDADGIPMPLNDIVVELFQSSDTPRINLAQRHVGNITKRARVTQCSTFLGLLYARRLKRQNPEFMKQVTSAELFLVSMMLATKFLYDEGEDEEFFNDEWAHVGKLDVKRVHELERNFLQALDWNLFVDPLEFFEFLQAVETRIAHNQGSKRGWFSYTDMFVLMNTPELYQTCLDVIEQSLKIVCVCAMVYGLCAATMLWSGVMLHQAQVPHRACHGRLPLPFALQHTKTTRPWQPNPVLDQLLFTFLLRLPVNSDPLGLTYDHSLTWCSTLPTMADNKHDTDDIGHDDEVTSRDASIETTVTGCNDQNVSQVILQDTGEHQENEGEVSEGVTSSNESKKMSSKVSNIQEALLIFYHALVTAVLEVGEVVREANSDGFMDMDADMNMDTTVVDTDDMMRRKPKKSCPYHRNANVKSSQSKMNSTANILVYQLDIKSLPGENRVAVDDKDGGDAIDTRDWDMYGAYMAEDPDLK